MPLILSLLGLLLLILLESLCSLIGPSFKAQVVKLTNQNEALTNESNDNREKAEDGPCTLAMNADHGQNNYPIQTNPDFFAVFLIFMRFACLRWIRIDCALLIAL